MRILSVDTATKACSAAISEVGDTVDSRAMESQQYSHAENLHLMIDDLLKSNAWEPNSLSAVLVSKGPGSYTGLRIGVSAAKGLCFGLGIPLMAVSTLRLLCEDPEVQNSDTVWYCPMIDARRNEVYTALYDRQGKIVRPVEAMILDDHPYNAILEEKKVAFFGDGSEKFRDQIKHENALFIPNVTPNAADFSKIANQMYRDSEFEDVAYFEPFYLKDFIAGKPKKGL